MQKEKEKIKRDINRWAKNKHSNFKPKIKKEKRQIKTVLTKQYSNIQKQQSQVSCSKTIANTTQRKRKSREVLTNE